MEFRNNGIVYIPGKIVYNSVHRIFFLYVCGSSWGFISVDCIEDDDAEYGLLYSCCVVVARGGRWGLHECSRGEKKNFARRKDCGGDIVSTYVCVCMYMCANHQFLHVKHLFCVYHTDRH